MRLAICGLLALALGVGGLGAASPSTPEDPIWARGMYWTFQTGRTYSPSLGGWDDDEGSLTFLVLDAGVLGNCLTGYLAVFSETPDGRETLDIISHVGPVDAYVRWPVVVDFLPRVEMSAPATGLTAAIAAFPWIPTTAGFPGRIARAFPISISSSSSDEPLPKWMADALEAGMAWEEITIAEGVTSEIVTLAGVFPTAIPIEFRWEAFGERHSGEAWWAPEVGWWVHAAGQEESEDRVTLTYTISLAEWGVLSSEEARRRLKSACQSTEEVDPNEAGRLRGVLEDLGWSCG